MLVAANSYLVCDEEWIKYDVVVGESIGIFEATSELLYDLFLVLQLGLTAAVLLYSPSSHEAAVAKNLIMVCYIARPTMQAQDILPAY